MMGTILRQHYKIIQKLGEGGFGETYLAENFINLPTKSKSKCVVKRLKQNRKEDTKEVERFKQEAAILKDLGDNHDQIPKLIDYFNENLDFYLIQEYIEGIDLTYEISPDSIWDEDEVINLLFEILEILSTVHQRRIIHRDIKPSNIMRRYDGNKFILIDFGIAKSFTNQLQDYQLEKNTSTVIGTLAYMPTEQLEGNPKPSSDIYSLGLTAIQALMGKMPTREPNTSEFVWREYAKVSNLLGDFLTKMVKRDFRQRYQDATEALQDLKLLKSPINIENPPIVAPKKKSHNSLKIEDIRNVNINQPLQEIKNLNNTLRRLQEIKFSQTVQEIKNLNDNLRKISTINIANTVKFIQGLNNTLDTLKYINRANYVNSIQSLNSTLDGLKYINIANIANYVQALQSLNTTLNKLKPMKLNQVLQVIQNIDIIVRRLQTIKQGQDIVKILYFNSNWIQYLGIDMAKIIADTQKLNGDLKKLQSSHLPQIVIDMKNLNEELEKLNNTDLPRIIIRIQSLNGVLENLQDIEIIELVRKKMLYCHINLKTLNSLNINPIIIEMNNLNNNLKILHHANISEVIQRINHFNEEWEK